MSKIIEENIKLAFSCAHKFNKYYEWHSKYDYEDVISDCLLGLVKAAKYFDADSEICFSTFAHICMKNEIMMSLRYKKKHRDHINIDDITIFIKKVSESLEEEKIIEYLWLQSSLESLNELEKKVISLYYFKNIKIYNIAKILCFSDSYISKIHGNAIKKLRKYI